MNKYVVVIIIASFLLSGCREHVSTIIKLDDFEKNITLESEVIEIGNNKYDGILFADTILVGFKGVTQTNFVDLFTLDFKPLASICWMGNGPDEFLNLALEPYSGFTDEGQIKMWGFDHMTNTAVLINFTKSVELNKTVVDKSIEFPTTVGSFEAITPTIIVGISKPSAKGEVLIYDVNEDRFVRTFRPYNDYVASSRYTPGYFLNNFIGTHKFIVNFSTLNRIDVVDIDTGEIETFSLESDPYKTDRINFNDPVEVYTMVFTTKDYVVGLYVNESVRQLMEDPLTEKEIHIFDKSFRPLVRIHINEHPIILTYDEHSGYMYGTSSRDHLFRFYIKNILQDL